VKVHHVVRRSVPLRPRVMRRLPVRGRRSVGAGIRRRGMELRNHTFGVSTLCKYGEDNTMGSDYRARQLYGRDNVAPPGNQAETEKTNVDL